MAVGSFAVGNSAGAVGNSVVAGNSAVAVGSSVVGSSDPGKPAVAVGSSAVVGNPVGCSSLLISFSLELQLSLLVSAGG